MKRYKISDSGGSTEIISAESLEAALEAAKDWAADCYFDYEETVSYSVYVDEINDASEPNGEHASCDVDPDPDDDPSPEVGHDSNQ